VLERLRRPWSDRRAELTLGAASCAVCLGIALMIIFVALKAWPTTDHNGLSWLGSGGNLNAQLGVMENTGATPAAAAYHLRAWPIIYGSLLTTFFAIGFGLVLALCSAIFIAEFAPARMRRVIIPVVRLLAAVPSVIYGLVGVLVLVPFVGNHLITQGEKSSVNYVVQLDGAGLLVAVVILTVMVTPIMVSLITDALTSVPRPWREGALALGAHPLRATIAVSLRAIRPAIVAAAVLAAARAFGEAVMLSMVSGSVAFAPKPQDGLIFLYEPLQTLASTIVDNSDGLTSPALKSSAYSFALLLLFSAFVLSVGSYLVKLPMRRYQVAR
jgi:phosphate transport system permease protein